MQSIEVKKRRTLTSKKLQEKKQGKREHGVMAGGLAAVRGEGGAIQEADDVGEDVGWEGGDAGGTTGFAGFGGGAGNGICG